MQEPQYFDPHMVDASWPPGEAPWELPRGGGAPPPEALDLYADLFLARAPAPEAAPAAEAAEGAWLLRPDRPAPARPARPRRARAEPEAAEAEEGEGWRGRVPPKVLRVGEIDIDSHLPTLGRGAGPSNPLEGADLKKILVDPPAGGSIVPARILLPLLLLLILGAPLAIWPGAPARLLDSVGRWFGPSGPEGAVKLREIQAAWIGGGKYAIQAEATNEGAAPLEWVRVEARARAEGLVAAAVQSAYCGKVLDLGQIASMDPAEIRAFHGEPGPNSGARAKESVTCQVVLTGLPAAPERFDLVVAKAELVARAPAAGAEDADQEEGLASEEVEEEAFDPAAPEAP